MFYEELSKVAAEDIAWNVTNLAQKVEERSIKLHQWLYRLRTMQHQYNRLVASKEEMLSDIVVELEDSQKSMIVSKQSTIKRAEKDPRYKKLLQEITDLEYDIEFTQGTVDTLKFLWRDHGHRIAIMQEEKL